MSAPKARDGPLRLLRAIAGGERTIAGAAKKARVKKESASVYVYRHREAGRLTRRGELKLTAKGRAHLQG